MQLTVVGILDGLELRGAPPRTIEAPAMSANSTFVSSGAFVSLRTSQEIFGRPTLTDALVVARSADDVPSLVASIQEQFRLEPGVFVTERYSEFQRKVHDFVLTLGLFTTISAVTALLAGSFAANLLNDIYSDRRRQYAVLNVLGFSPALSLAPGIALGMAIVLAGAVAGSIAAFVLLPPAFAMPSLMADLGTVEPTMDWAVGIIVIAVAVAAFALGISSVGWRLNRHSVLATLTEGAP
jgi:ABC-type antimicrobial peptide transport system permease subunit